MREATLQTPGSVKKEGEAGVWSRDSPAACADDRMREAGPLQPAEVHGGADVHLHPVEAK